MCAQGHKCCWKNVIGALKIVEVNKQWIEEEEANYQNWDFT